MCHEPRRQPRPLMEGIAHSFSEHRKHQSQGLGWFHKLALVLAETKTVEGGRPAVPRRPSTTVRSLRLPRMSLASVPHRRRLTYLQCQECLFPASPDIAVYLGTDLSRAKTTARNVLAVETASLARYIPLGTYSCSVSQQNVTSSILLGSRRQKCHSSRPSGGHVQQQHLAWA